MPELPEVPVSVCSVILLADLKNMNAGKLAFFVLEPFGLAGSFYAFGFLAFSLFSEQC